MWAHRTRSFISALNALYHVHIIFVKLQHTDGSLVNRCIVPTSRIGSMLLYPFRVYQTHLYRSVVRLTYGFAGFAGFMFGFSGKMCGATSDIMHTHQTRGFA